MAKKILIVDDDPAILDATQMLLELEGFVVQAALKAETVYGVDYGSIDLILLDIWLSGHDGLEICKYLKKNPKTQTIPIIMVSASGEVQKATKEAGADDFLAKPYEIDDLVEKIKKNLKKVS